MRSTFIFTVLLIFVGLMDGLAFDKNATKLLNTPVLLSASNESFESGLGGWVQSSSDDMNWSRKTGSTGSSYTGPSGAYDGSYYIYTEASSPNYPSKSAIITSPTYDFSTISAFTFNYHMYGATIGSIHLQISTNGGASWETIWSKYGDLMGDSWQSKTVDLSSHTGNGMLRFSATTGSSYTGDIALDNFVFTSSSVSCDYSLSIDNSENYVFTRIYLEPMTSSSGISDPSDVMEQVTYIDGLGRPKQQVGIGHAGTACKDLVTHITYDEYGRQTKDYLPYVDTGISGSYRTEDIDSNTRSYYNGAFPDDFNDVLTANPYSEKKLEASPLSRPEKQAAPGYDWRLGGGHEIEYDYQTNTTGEVLLYSVGLTPTTYNTVVTYVPQLVYGGSYTAGELYKTVTRDENHTSGTAHTTEEFTDKQGRVILKRNYGASDTNGDGDTADPGEINVTHSTYYVYDDYGNLTYVLPPKIVHDSSISTNELNGLAYQYVYDQRNRLVEKKLPGKNKEYIVYNKLDQPVLTQDAHLKSKGKWLYTKYDAFGRVVSTGLFTNSASSQPVMQHTLNNYYNGSAVAWETKTTTSSNNYYTNQAYPVSGIEPLTINYYDNYTFNTTSQGLKLNSGTLVYGTAIYYNVKGLPTGSKVKVLDQSTPKWITTVMHYDAKGRQIYTGSYDELLLVKNTIKNELDFTGNVIKTENYHKKGSAAAITAVDIYEYDHMKRLTIHSQSINGGAQEIIAANTYDELGQLKTKDVGNALQTVDYTYNVRGWLKSINDVGNLGTDLFSFEISYNNPELSGSVGLYNGNISETIWQTANDKNASTPVSSRAYQFEYDDLNRLVDADYFVNSSTPYITEFDMSSAYDKNGNITKLSRGRSYGTIDALSYSYNNNQLIEVVDNGYSTSKGKGFVDDGVAGNDYTYDANGNLTSDANKGITDITYNHLNLPVDVEFNNSSSETIHYTYDAAGTKLRKEIPGKTTDYAGNFIYEGGTLQFFSTPEGYVSYDNGQFNYVYNYVDHLGNVRLSYTDGDGDGSIDPATEIIQEKNYYPFGLTHQGYNGGGSPYGNAAAKRYGFGGKELQDETFSGNTLDWYDVSARNYDPALGRWMNIDPLAEQMRRHSPYNYAFNNPLVFSDPDGMAPFDVIVNGDKSDEYVKQLNESSSLTITRNEETGKLSATGEASSEADQELLAAINDDNVTVNVNATSDATLDNGKPLLGGAFGGSKVNEDGSVDSYQSADPEVQGNTDKASGRGNGVGALHETLEGYAEGKRAEQSGTGSPDASTSEGYNNYVKAHNQAQQIDPRYNSGVKIGFGDNTRTVAPGVSQTTRTITAKLPNGKKVKVGEKVFYRKF